MKTVLFIFFTILVSGFAASSDNDENVSLQQIEPLGIFEDVINNTLNDITATLSDLITLPSFTLPLETDNVKISLAITNFELKNLNKIIFSFLKVGLVPLSLNATLLLNPISLNTEYKLDANIENITLNEQGNFGIDLTLIPLKIFANLKGGLIPLNVTISDLILEVEQPIKYTLTFTDENNPALANALKDYIDSIIALIFYMLNNPSISNIIKDLINSILQSSSELL